MAEINSGYVKAQAAEIYFEQAGEGTDFVMLHAGVADARQWDTSFTHFADTFRTLRYDMRGFGRSVPVPGNYRPIDDLRAVIDHANVREPAILMGCSMGGTLAMDFTLAYPESVSALIMVCSGPSGLKLDVPAPEKFKAVEAAYEAGDIDLCCELETQIWFDGESRSPSEVDPEQRALLYEMNKTALMHDAVKGVGERQHNLETAAYKRLDEIEVPVLVIVGTLDIPYTHAAAGYMCERIKDVTRVEISDAAHLPSMEQPQIFNDAVAAFLGTSS